LQGAQKLGRETRAAGELGDLPESAHGRDRHDAGDNRNLDARERAALAKIQKVPIIKKKLGDNVIGAGVNLRFEMIHFV
jgi:hypothetical protein